MDVSITPGRPDNVTHNQSVNASLIFYEARKEVRNARDSIRLRDGFNGRLVFSIKQQTIPAGSDAGNVSQVAQARVFHRDERSLTGAIAADLIALLTLRSTSASGDAKAFAERNAANRRSYAGSRARTSTGSATDDDADDLEFSPRRRVKHWNLVAGG